MNSYEHRLQEGRDKSESQNFISGELLGGVVVERRSYDPFGQRRNPIWGQPTPMSFTSATTLGYTGHESDDELGLINMRGRIFDPKVGRFLSVDPIVSAPLFGQSWNAYTYTFNNPLAYTDPSGFDPAYNEPPVDPGYANNPDVQRILASGCMGLECSRPAVPVEGPREVEQVGAARPPVDVSPTGNTASYEPQPVTEAPEDWSKDSYVQIEGGFLAGLGLGFVPYAGLGHQVLDATHVLPHGSANARLGLAVGQIVGGLALVVGGATGELLGGAVSGSGSGALVGVPAMAVSATLVTGGIGNVMAGIYGVTPPHPEAEHPPRGKTSAPSPSRTKFASPPARSSASLPRSTVHRKGRGHAQTEQESRASQTRFS